MTKKAKLSVISLFISALLIFSCVNVFDFFTSFRD